MATWAEIQKLAADLQRLQLTQGVKRLSEKNCVEVVSKLIETRLVDIVFTTDGRQYVTRKHLLNEVRNECLGRGGRASLAEIATALSLSFSHVEEAASQLVNQHDFILSVGELISKEYVDEVCANLAEQLNECGQMEVWRVAKGFPAELVHNHILPTLISPQHDILRHEELLYTRAHHLALKNSLRAMLIALTKVRAVSELQSHLGVSPSLFFLLWDELASEKAIPGHLGSRHPSSLYIPRLHDSLVRAFVAKQFQQERCIQHNVLKKLSVNDATTFLQSVLPNVKKDTLVMLPSVILAQSLWTETVEALHEALRTQSYTDMSMHLPVVASGSDDVAEAVRLVVKTNAQYHSAGTHFVYTDKLIGELVKRLAAVIDEKAEIEAGNWGKRQAIARRTEGDDEDWAKGGKGGKKKKGGGARATGGKASERSAETAITLGEQVVRGQLLNDDLPSELLTEVLDDVLTAADAQLRERVEERVRNAETNASAGRKVAHAQLGQRLLPLLARIVLFDDAAGTFPGDVGGQLRGFLQRTLCTTAMNEIVGYMCSLSDVTAMTARQRDDAIAAIASPEQRVAMQELVASVNTPGESLNAFWRAIDRVASPAIAAIDFRPPDKKRRIELMSDYEKELESELLSTKDPASALLLALLILLLRRQSVAVHASGKFVLHLLDRMGDLEGELRSLLMETQRLVVAGVKAKNGDKAINEKLRTRMETIKQMVGGGKGGQGNVIDE